MDHLGTPYCSDHSYELLIFKSHINAERERRTLESKRTILRRFQISDLDKMRELESDPEIMKFTRMRIPQTLEQTKERLSALLKRESIDHPLGVWAVELKEDSDFVGWFMLRKIEGEIPELGFMLVKKHWGKGLATEISKALVDFGINKLKLPGITATTTHDNFASIKVLGKAGFKLLKTQHVLDAVLGIDTEINVFQYVPLTP